MTTVHDNEFLFEAQTSDIEISFTYGNDYIVSDGQPFDGVTTKSANNELTITVKAGRHGTSRCADWFNSSVDGVYSRMIHTLGGDNKPKELNFAIKGVLVINGTSFNICLGQGHHDSNNNWHLASDKMTADENAKNGTLGEYRLSQSDTHKFIVSAA
ncbi:hypothetical protein [Celerinatantimonas diazotrophica]|uniref:Uncharacterized protein n=1 Tax=Celerinatantimonas diazotrophica TaxID=412034 RepID=A0A4R1KGX8_9GAMM|nr:hypothetical protein [Celerinatantimonas diazotrophica]TCK63974.1 hypothetical protein EV690_0088 [Celerinatantimonas diazotrophica]CAG9297059.1 hypothetical protein CEDIAZO_02221 [Celerinatantimonas diazotrophica]